MSDKIYCESKLCFDFTKSQSVIKADEKTYSGLLSVDFIVETKRKNIFIEVKNVSSETEMQRREEWIAYLSNFKQNHFLFEMGVKFKDTILRKWAMDESYDDKEIHYIVILEFNEFDANQRCRISENFHSYLPTCLRDFKRGVNLRQWKIYNVEEWNKNDCYGEFPIKSLD